MCKNHVALEYTFRYLVNNSSVHAIRYEKNEKEEEEQEVVEIEVEVEVEVEEEADENSR